MQTCSLNIYKKLLLLVLIFFNFTEAQSFSLDDAVKIALKNKEALKASALDLAISRQNINTRSHVIRMILKSPRVF